MGNRKENLKKSLGITEYPWSSDEESSPPVTASTSSNHTRGSFLRPSVSIPIRRRPEPTRIERDIFWKWINNVPTQSSSGASTSSQPVESRESVNLNNPVTNMQRIIAIDKLSRRIRRNLRGTTSAPSGFTSPQRRLRKRMANYRVPSYPSAGNNRSSIIPAVIDNPSTSEPRASSSRFPSSLPRLSSDWRSLVNPDTADTRLASEPQTSSRLTEDLQRLLESESSGLSENLQGRFIPEEPDSPQSPSTAVVPLDNLNVENIEVEASEDDIVEIEAYQEENDPEEDNSSNERPANTNEQEDEMVTTEVADAESTAANVAESREDAENSSEQELNQSLLHLLECPVCLECMEPPLAQCRRGHLVCPRCRARLASCPVCRTNFSTVRNRAMEAVAELVRYPCRHGCRRTLQLRERERHEPECPRLRYRCPAPACRAEPAALAPLLRHCREAHASILKSGDTHRLRLRADTSTTQIWLVSAAGALFALRVRNTPAPAHAPAPATAQRDGLRVQVIYVGPKRFTHRYLYNVTITAADNYRKLNFERETHSYLENTALDLSRIDCFSLSHEEAMKYARGKNRQCDSESCFDIVVTINKRGEFENPTPASGS